MRAPHVALAILAMSLLAPTVVAEEIGPADTDCAGRLGLDCVNTSRACWVFVDARTHLTGFGDSPPGPVCVDVDSL